MAEDQLVALLRALAPLHGEIDRLHNSLGALLESNPPLSADVLRDALRKGRNELAKVALRERSVVAGHALAAGIGKGKLPLPFLASHWPSQGHSQLDYQAEESAVANTNTAAHRTWRTTPGAGRSQNALLARTAEAVTPLWGHSFAAPEEVDVAATSARSRNRGATRGSSTSPHLFSSPQCGDENVPPRKNANFSSDVKSPTGSGSNSSANEETASSNQSLRQRRRALRALMRHLEQQLASQRAALHEHGLLDGQAEENSGTNAASGAESGNTGTDVAGGSSTGAARIGGSSASVRALEGDLAKVAAALKALDEHAAAAPHDARFATPLVVPLVTPFLASHPSLPPQPAAFSSSFSPHADEVAATLGPSAAAPATPSAAPTAYAPPPGFSNGSRQATAYAAYLAALYGTPPPASQLGAAPAQASDRAAAFAASSLPPPPPLQTTGAPSQPPSHAQPMLQVPAPAIDPRLAQPAPLHAANATRATSSAAAAPKALEATTAPARAPSPRPIGEATPSAERLRRDAALFAAIDDGFSIDEDEDGDDDGALVDSMQYAETAGALVLSEAATAASLVKEESGQQASEVIRTTMPPKPPLPTKMGEDAPSSLPVSLAFECSIAPPEWTQDLATSRCTEEEGVEDEAAATDEEAAAMHAHAGEVSSKASLALSSSSCLLPASQEGPEVRTESSDGMNFGGGDSAAGDSVANALQGLHLDDDDDNCGNDDADKEGEGFVGESFVPYPLAEAEGVKKACLEESPLKPPPLDLDCCLSLSLSEAPSGEIDPVAAGHSGIEHNMSADSRVPTNSPAEVSSKSLGAFEGVADAQDADLDASLHPSICEDSVAADAAMANPSLIAAAMAAPTANQPLLPSNNRAVRAIAPLRPIAAGTTPAGALNVDIAPSPVADDDAPPHPFLSPGSEPTPAARHGSSILQGELAQLGTSTCALGASIPDWPSNPAQPFPSTSEDPPAKKAAAESEPGAVHARQELSPANTYSDDDDNDHDDEEEEDSGSASTVSSSASASPDAARTAPLLLSPTHDSQSGVTEVKLTLDVGTDSGSQQAFASSRDAALGGEGPIPGDLSTVDEETPRHDESETTETTNYTDTTEYTNYSASPTTSPPTGAALAAANHAAAKRQLRLDITSFDMSRLRPVVTNSSFVAPAYDAATAVATEDIGNINAEFDFPGETEASCNSNERIGVADGVESEGACVDNAAIHNSTEFSPVLDGAAASSFEGPSFEQGLNPHSLRGSADSLINAVAATRAGIGAVRYDTVNRLLGEAFEEAWDSKDPDVGEVTCALRPEDNVNAQRTDCSPVETKLEGADVSIDASAVNNDICSDPGVTKNQCEPSIGENESAEESVEEFCTVSPLPSEKASRSAVDVPPRSAFTSPSKAAHAGIANLGGGLQPLQESPVASSPSSEHIENSRSFAQEHTSSLLSAASNSSYESLVGKIVSRGRGTSSRSENSYQGRHSDISRQIAEAKSECKVANEEGLMEQKWVHSESKSGGLDHGSSSQTVEALHGTTAASSEATSSNLRSLGTEEKAINFFEQEHLDPTTQQPTMSTALALVPEAKFVPPSAVASSVPSSAPTSAAAVAAAAMREKRALAAEAAERRAAASAAAVAASAEVLPSTPAVVSASAAPSTTYGVSTAEPPLAVSSVTAVAPSAAADIAAAECSPSAKVNPLPEAPPAVSTALIVAPFTAQTILAVNSNAAVVDEANMQAESALKIKEEVPASALTFPRLTASCDGTVVTANTATTAVSGKRKASRDYDDESFGAYEEDIIVDEAGANANNKMAFLASASNADFHETTRDGGHFNNGAFLLENPADGKTNSNNTVPRSSKHTFAPQNEPFGTAASFAMAPFNGEVEGHDVKEVEEAVSASVVDRFRTGTWSSPTVSGDEEACVVGNGLGVEHSSRQASASSLMMAHPGQQHADGSARESFRGSAGASADWSSPDETNRQSLDSVTVGSPVRATAPATSERDVCEFQPQPLPPHPFHAATHALAKSVQHERQQSSAQQPTSLPSFNRTQTHPLPPPPPPTHPNRASWDLLPWSGGAHTHSVDILDSVVSSLTTDNASTAGIGSLHGGGFGGAHNFGHGAHNGGNNGGCGGNHFAMALPQHMLNAAGSGSSRGGSPMHHRSAGWRGEASPSLRVRHHSDDVEGLSSGAANVNFKETIAEKEEVEPTGAPSGSTCDDKESNTAFSPAAEPEPSFDDDEEAAVAAFRAELVLAASASAARGRSAGAGFASGFAAGAAYGLSAMNHHASSSTSSPTSSSSSKGEAKAPSPPLAPTVDSKKMSPHSPASVSIDDQQSTHGPRINTGQAIADGRDGNSMANFAPEVSGTDLSPPSSPPALASRPLSGSSSVASTPGRLAVRPASLDLAPSGGDGDNGETPRVAIHLAASSNLLFPGSTDKPSSADDPGMSSAAHRGQIEIGSGNGDGDTNEAPAAAGSAFTRPAIGKAAPLPWSQASPAKGNAANDSPRNNLSPAKTTGNSSGSGNGADIGHTLSPPLAHALFVDNGGDTENESDDDDDGAVSREEGAHPASIAALLSGGATASATTQEMASKTSLQQWFSPVVSREFNSIGKSEINANNDGHSNSFQNPSNSRSGSRENSREHTRTPPADFSHSDGDDASPNASISLTASSILVGLRNGSPGPRHPTNSSRRLDVALAEVGWLTEPSPRAENAVLDGYAAVGTAAGKGEGGGGGSKYEQYPSQHLQQQQLLEQQQQRYASQGGLVPGQSSSSFTLPACYSEGMSSSSSERPKSLTPRRKARLPLHGSSRQSPHAWPNQQLQQQHQSEGTQGNSLAEEQLQVSAELSTSPIEAGFAIPRRRVENEEESEGDEEDAELAAAEAQREALWAAAERAAVRRAGLQNSSPSSTKPPPPLANSPGTVKATAKSGMTASPSTERKPAAPSVPSPGLVGIFQGSSPFRPPRLGHQVLSPIAQPADSLRRSVGALEQILERWADEDDDRTLSGRTHPVTATATTANTATESPAKSQLVSRAASAPLPFSGSRHHSSSSSSKSDFSSPLGLKKSAHSMAADMEVVAGVPLLPPREIPRILPSALPTFTAAPPLTAATPSRDCPSNFSSSIGNSASRSRKSSGSSPVVLAPVAAPPSASKRPLPRPPSPAALRAASATAGEDDNEVHAPFSGTTTDNRGRPYTTTPNRSRSRESNRTSRTLGSAEGGFLALSPEPRLPPATRKLSSGDASPPILQLRSTISPPPSETTPPGAGERLGNLAASSSGSGHGSSLLSIHDANDSGKRSMSAPLMSLPMVSGAGNSIREERMLVLSPPEKVSFSGRLRSGSGGDGAGFSGTSARHGQDTNLISRHGYPSTNGSSESHQGAFGDRGSAEESDLLPVARGLQFDNEVENNSTPAGAAHELNDHYSASAAILGEDCQLGAHARGQVQYENYSAYEENASDDDVYEDEGSSDASWTPENTGANVPHEPKESNNGSRHSVAAGNSGGGGMMSQYPYYANESASDHHDGDAEAKVSDRFLQMSTDEELELAEAQGLAEANLPNFGRGNGRGGGLATYGAGEWRASNDSNDDALHPRPLSSRYNVGANFDYDNSDSSGGYEDVNEDGSTNEQSLTDNNSSYGADDSYERGRPPTGNAHSGGRGTYRHDDLRDLSGSHDSSLESFSAAYDSGGPMSGQLPGGVASAFGRFSSLLAAVDQQNQSTEPVKTSAVEGLRSELNANVEVQDNFGRIFSAGAGLETHVTPQNTKSFDGRFDGKHFSGARSTSEIDRLSRSSLPSLGGATTSEGSSTFEPSKRGRTPPPRNPAALLAPLTGPGGKGGGGIKGGKSIHSGGRAHSASPSFSQRVPLGQANQGTSLESGSNTHNTSNNSGPMTAAAATPQLRLRPTDPSPTGVGAFYGTPSPQQPPQTPSHYQEITLPHSIPLYGSHSKGAKVHKSGSTFGGKKDQRSDLSDMSKTEQERLMGSDVGHWRGSAELL